ncbi:MAG: universal stress protein [Pseudomonadota bacterium]
MPQDAPLAPILVATDLSDRSAPAVARAIRLARDQSTRLILVSVIDDALPLDVTADVARHAEAHLRDVMGDEDDVPHEIDVRVGDPTGDILRAVDQHNAGLLVLGPHRPRPFLDMLRETTMQRIVRRTEAPVLLVIRPATADYGATVAAVDFSPASAGAVSLAAKLAPGAKITPVHGLHVPYVGRIHPESDPGLAIEASFRAEAEAAAAAWSAHQELAVPTLQPVRIETGSALTVLRGAVADTGADLIAAGAHGRVGAAPSLLGSVATDLMRDPPCDVLIAR